MKRTKLDLVVLGYSAIAVSRHAAIVNPTRSNRPFFISTLKHHYQMVAMLHELFADDLVTLHRIRGPGGDDQVFEIAPGYLGVLDEALYE